MEKIVSNVVPIKESDALKEVDVYVIKSLTDDYITIGNCLRKLRGENKFIPIIQSGNRLFSLKELNMNMKCDRLFEDFKIIKLKAIIREDREIIRRLLGEAVAVMLRNDASNKWMVEEVTNTVFDVTRNVRLEGYGEIELYAGFRYMPIITHNGKAAVIIDPKYKFHSKRNLRELSLALNEIKIPNKFRDFCPMDSCPEKSNTHTACKLARVGKTVEVVRWINKKPSEVEVKPGINLIEYHSREETCPLKILDGHIVDESPVAEIKHNDKAYCYPLERLREIPEFRMLNEEDRDRLMNEIRSDPKGRFYKTRFFSNTIKIIKFGENDLELQNIGDPWGMSAICQFDRPITITGNNVNTNVYHYSQLLDKQPYDYANVKQYKIKIFVLHPQKLSEKERKVVAGIFKNKNNFERTITFASLLKINVSDVVFKHYDEIDELINTNTNLQENEKIAVIVIYDENYSKLYTEIELKLIYNNIPKQGINLKNFMNYYETKRQSYFGNIFFGLYSKLGFTPWIIKEYLNSDQIIYGYSTFRRTQYGNNSIFGSLFVGFDNQGKFKHGVFFRTKKENYFEEQISFVSELFDEIKEPIILKHGTFNDKELDFFLNYGNKNEKDLILIEVITSTPLRLYSITNKSIIGAAKQGTCMYLNNNEVGLITTRVSAGTPQAILLRFKNLGHPNKIKSLLKTIFNLTQIHIGWERNYSKLPIPLHFSSKSLSKLMKFDAESFIFELPWFI